MNKNDKIKITLSLAIFIAIVINTFFMFQISNLLQNGNVEKKQNTIEDTSSNTNTSDTSSSNENKPDLSNEKNTLTYVSNGTFIVKDGKIVEKDESVGETLAWYFDPMCPACVNLESSLSEDIPEISSKMPIQYYPMDFFSNNDKNNFSHKAGAMLLSVVETRPDIALKFMTAVISPDFQQENRTNDEFKSKFIEVGGKEEEWNTVLSYLDITGEQISNSTMTVNANGELDSKAPKKEDGSQSMYIPFLVIGNSDKNINFSESGDSTAKDFILNSIDKYNNK